MPSHTPPLQGLSVLLPSRLEPVLRDALEAAGAEVHEVTLLERRPVASAALDELPQRIGHGEVDWLVIASAYTVDALELLGHPLRELATSRVRLAAVGPVSAAAVERACGRIDLAPDSGTGTAALARAFPPGPGRVVAPGAARPSPGLPGELAARGWEVEELAVYTTEPVTSVPEAVVARWRAGGYDALVVTSGSVARAAASLLGQGGSVVALGAGGGRAAVEAGFLDVRVSDSAVADDLVRMLASI